MLGKIKLSNGNELEVLANAATPFRMKQAFNIDLMKIFGNSAESNNGMEIVDIIPQLVYVMSEQAKHHDLTRINNNTFVEWAENYEVGDFIVNAEQIIDIYLGTTITTSISKKKKN
jgi:hypothetical protein